MKPKAGAKPSIFLKCLWLMEYTLTKTIFFILFPIPFKKKIALGKKLGLISYHLLKQRREMALSNLKGYFTELTDKQIEEIAKKSFEHLGRLFIEIIFLKSSYKYLFSISKLEGFVHLQEVVSRGSGYILASGHFGNWEYVAYSQSALGYTLNMVTRRLDNPYLENFLKKIREHYGNRVIYKRNAVREMVKRIKNGEGVAFVFDQNFGEDGAYFVPFLKRMAATTPVLGKVAARLNVPIIPVFSFSEGIGYKVIYYEPIYPKSTLGYEENSLFLTEMVTKLLEDAIKNQPNVWFWMHNRFRTQIEGGSSG